MSHKVSDVFEYRNVLPLHHSKPEDGNVNFDENEDISEDEDSLEDNENVQSSIHITLTLHPQKQVDLITFYNFVI
ncbi:7411_t:CDS:2 [Funneliformis geosporum]|nr:7411_t:CDS:2 [Funneliformis geosporum]